MREVAILFGEQKSLVGIVTDPGEASSGIAVILLNAGFTHHVGPQRFYVRLARRLAELGVTTLRFDHSGIGDSPRRQDNLPFPDGVIKDAKEAMDFLQATRGIHRFVVGGICWGADNAIRVSGADPRVVGGIAIDFYALPSLRHLVRVYTPRLLSLRSWGNLLRGSSGLLGSAVTLAVATLRSAVAPKEKGDDVLPSLPPAAVMANITEMTDRGVNLCFAYATGAVSYDQYVGRFRKPMRELEQQGKLRVKVFPGADHLFTLRVRQTELLEFLFEWTRDLVAAGRGEVERSPSEPVASADS